MTICWHKFEKWSELIAGYNNEKTQYRKCATCGKIQFRSLGYCNGTDAFRANEALERTK